MGGQRHAPAVMVTMNIAAVWDVLYNEHVPKLPVEPAVCIYVTNLLTVFAQKVAAVGKLGALANKLPDYAAYRSTAGYLSLFFVLSVSGLECRTVRDCNW